MALGRADALAGGLTDMLRQAELLADGAQLLAFEAVSVGVHQPLPMVDIEVFQHNTTHGIRSMQLSLVLDTSAPASNHVKPMVREPGHSQGG